jgi:hypothetical protein
MGKGGNDSVGSKPKRWMEKEFAWFGDVSFVSMFSFRCDGSATRRQGRKGKDWAKAKERSFP